MAAPTLTTTFIPLSSCLSSVYYWSEPQTVYWKLGGPRTQDCFPSGWNPTATFSPGIQCPSGYVTACSSTTTNGITTETVATCCPRSYTCQNSPLVPFGVLSFTTQRCGSSWGFLSGSTGSDVAVSTTAISLAIDSAGSVSFSNPTASVTISEGGVNAYGVVIRYQASDLVTTTSSTSTSTSTTAAPITGSTTLPTQTSTDSPIPGGGGGGLSTGAKIGLGVGIPLAIIALALIGVFFFLRRRKQAAAAAAPEIGQLTEYELEGHPKPHQPTEPVELAGYPAQGWGDTQVYYHPPVSELGGTPAPHATPPASLSPEWPPNQIPSPSQPQPSTLAASPIPVSSPSDAQFRESYASGSPTLSSTGGASTSGGEDNQYVTSLRQKMERVKEEQRRLQRLQELSEEEERLQRELAARGEGSPGGPSSS